MQAPMIPRNSARSDSETIWASEEEVVCYRPTHRKKEWTRSYGDEGVSGLPSASNEKKSIEDCAG